MQKHSQDGDEPLVEVPPIASSSADRKSMAAGSLDSAASERYVPSACSPGQYHVGGAERKDSCYVKN